MTSRGGDHSRHPNSVRATQRRPIGLQPASPPPPMPTYPPGKFCLLCGLTRSHWAGCTCLCRSATDRNENCPTHRCDP